MKFNVNEHIKVKLTEAGLQVHKAKHEEFWNRLGKLSEFPYSEPKTDDDGFVKMQLWQFMETFGSEFGMTKPNLIEGNDIYLL